LEHFVDEHLPCREVACHIRGILAPTLRGVSVQAVTDALLEAVIHGEAYEGEGQRGTRTIGRQPASRHVSATDRAILYWEEHPQASVRDVAVAVDCGVGTASRARSLAVPSTARSGVPSVHEDGGTWNGGPSDRGVPTPLSPPPLGGGEGDGTASGRHDEVVRGVPSVPSSGWAGGGGTHEECATATAGQEAPHA
jgi:hypothetical protein